MLKDPNLFIGCFRCPNAIADCQGLTIIVNNYGQMTNDYCFIKCTTWPNSYFYSATK